MRNTLGWVAHPGFFLANTTVFVAALRPTGSAAAATTKRFHEEGATVIVTGSNPTTVEAARKAMPYLEAVVSDSGDPEAAMALLDRIMGPHGRIDVLFVNAGITRVAQATATTETLFDMLFTTNARVPYFLLKHAILVLSDGASIILTSVGP